MAAEDPPKQEGIVAQATLEIPNGTLVQHTVFVVAYYDNEGQERYAFGLRGEASAANAIGLLRIVEAHMIAEVMGAQ